MATITKNFISIILWVVSLIWSLQVVRMYLLNNFVDFLIWGISFLVFMTIVVGLYYVQGELNIAESYISGIAIPLIVIYPFLPFIYTRKPVLNLKYPDIVRFISKDPMVLETLTLIICSIILSFVIRSVIANVFKNKKQNKKMLSFLIFTYTILMAFFVFLSSMPEIVKIVKNSDLILLKSMIEHFSWMKKVLPTQILYGVPALISVLMAVYFTEILKTKVEQNNS